MENESSHRTKSSQHPAGGQEELANLDLTNLDLTNLDLTNLDLTNLDLTNLDKVFFPDAGLTKGHLIDYYRRIAARMLPWLRDRALVMHRFPDGIEGDSFFQKDRPDHFPDWIPTTTLAKSDGETTYVVCQDVATLVYLTNQGCLEPHVWLSRIDRPDRPDHMVFDLDPSLDLDAGGLDDVRHAAEIVRDVLDRVDLPAFVKSTGSRGLHIHVPIDPDEHNETVYELARAVAQRAIDRAPDRLTLEQRKDARGDRLFVDTLRHHYAQHAVAPYGVRPLPGGPVALPLDWHEAVGSDFHPRAYTIENIFRRLAQKDRDPWESFDTRRGSVSAARRRLEELT